MKRVVADRFEILEQIGSGGMGTVYRATDRQTGTDVALKVLRSASAGHERFLREARVLEQLEHPSVVRFIAHGQDANDDADTQHPFLAMEWIHGEDLQKHLERSGPLSIRDALDLIERLAGGLALAHSRGITHRDIKPSNILLEGDDVRRARLADFGLASLSSSLTASKEKNVALTVTGEVLGTPSYMAPEQARGLRSVDSRVDVFALGCVLYECLVAEPAFGGLNVRAVLAKILFEEAPRASWHRADVPFALDALIASMLVKDPAERLPDASAVLSRLAAIESAPSTPPTSSTPSQLLGDATMRWVFVVVASPEADVIAHADTQAIGGGGEDEVTHEKTKNTKERIAHRYGGELKELADGTLFVLLRSQQTSAADGAAMAARCALALRDELPAARISLAALRVHESSGAMRVGELLERAVAQHAVAGHVTVDLDVVSLLESRFELLRKPDGTIELEREHNAVAAVRARLLLGRATPIVGRERELASLRATLEECVEEQVARAVIVTAGPGIGKTRLQQELLAATVAADFEVWLARADAMSAGAPMHLAGRLIGAACGIDQVYEARERRRGIEHRLAAAIGVQDVGGVAEFLGEIAGAQTDSPSRALEAAREDPFAMNEAIRSAWETFVSTTRRPLLIVLEDLHWGDLPSVKLIDAALRKCESSGVPLAVLALARPNVFELFPQLWGSRQPLHLPLPELSPRARERLIRHVLQDTVSNETVERLAALSAGNAFFLEELIRASAEDRGGGRATGTVQLPVSVAAMIEARLDALSGSARRVLHLASVFGEVFWIDGVRALLPPSERAEVPKIVEDLISRELFTPSPTPSRFAHQREVTFRHALVREAAYRALSPPDAKAAHAIVADFLMSIGEREALVLAEHLDRAELSERAAVQYAEAATAALRSHDWQRAITYARRARSLLPPHELIALARMHVTEGEGLAWQGAVAEGAAACSTAVSALREAKVPTIEMCSTLGWTAILTAFASLRADLTFSKRISHDLLAVADSGVEHADFQRAIGYVLTVLYFAGAPEDALLLVEKTASKPSDLRARGWWCFHRQLHARFTLGDTWRSRELAFEAVQCFEQSVDGVGVAHLLTQAALDEASLGFWSSAYEHSTRARQMTDRSGIRLLGVMAYGVNAVAAAECGHIDEARELIRTTERHCNELGDAFYAAYSMALASRAARVCADYEKAKELGLWAIEHTGLVAIQATAGMQLANVALALGDHEAAYAQTGYVIEMSRGRVLRGGFDLDLWVALVSSLRALGRPEVVAATARARKLIDFRAGQIPDLDLRKTFLSSKWVLEITNDFQ